MADYRNAPHASPFIWCARCGKLVPKTEATQVMKTVYRVEPHGVYPYGFCEQHKKATS